jgi:hypothetical protein
LDRKNSLQFNKGLSSRNSVVLSSAAPGIVINQAQTMTIPCVTPNLIGGEAPGLSNTNDGFGVSGTDWNSEMCGTEKCQRDRGFGGKSPKRCQHRDALAHRFDDASALVIICCYLATAGGTMVGGWRSDCSIPAATSGRQ